MMIGAPRSLDSGGLGTLPQYSVAMPPPQAAKPQGHNWAAILADTLFGLAGRPGIYPAQMERQREEQSALERGDEQYRRQRADHQADQQAEWDHQRPTGYAAELAAAGIGGDEATKLLQQHARNSADPFVSIPMENGTFNGPRSDFYSQFGNRAAPAPATSPVGKLHPMGGAGPQTPHNFPGRRSYPLYR